MAATSNRTISGFLEHIWSPEAPHCVVGSTTESLDYGMVHNRALLSRREEQAQPKKILGYQQTPNFPVSYWRSNCRIGCIGKPVQGNAQKAIWDLMLFLLLPDCARVVKFLKKSIRCWINETPSYAFFQGEDTQLCEAHRHHLNRSGHRRALCGLSIRYRESQKMEELHVTVHYS